MKERSQLKSLQRENGVSDVFCEFVLTGNGLAYQFEAVVKDKHFARTLRGKISPVTTQAPGPKVLAKKTM